MGGLPQLRGLRVFFPVMFRWGLGDSPNSNQLGLDRIARKTQVS